MSESSHKKRNMSIKLFFSHKKQRTGAKWKIKSTIMIITKEPYLDVKQMVLMA